MILGDYTFEWVPDEMSIPETKKTVSVVPTYGGSAIFQWAPIIQGSQVTMKWNFTSIAQYNALRLEYLKSEMITWTTEGSPPIVYNVIVVNLTGKYFKVHLDDLEYREDVELILDIRGTV